MRNLRYWVKRSIMRIGCLFGKHNIKLSALGYRVSGCLWCKKPMRRRCTDHAIGQWHSRDEYARASEVAKWPEGYRATDSGFLYYSSCPECGEKL
jgi:hypothetical protein